MSVGLTRRGAVVVKVREEAIWVLLHEDGDDDDGEKNLSREMVAASTFH